MWDDPADGSPLPIGQHLANLRRKGGLGKDPDRAARRAQQLAAIDEDWKCPWPLNWQLHYRILADLVDADGALPGPPRHLHGRSRLPGRRTYMRGAALMLPGQVELIRPTPADVRRGAITG